jgi:hypothetical protein
MLKRSASVSDMKETDPAAAFVENRKGAVLGKGYILKADIFPTGKHKV